MSKSRTNVHQTSGERPNARPDPDAQAADALITTLIAGLLEDPRLVAAIRDLALGSIGAVDRESPRGPTQTQSEEREEIGKVRDFSPSQRPAYDRFMRLPEVLHMTGLSRSTLYEKIEKGLFPKQVPLGVNMVGWYESEVRGWLQNPT